jgi:hypothetical protein
MVLVTQHVVFLEKKSRMFRPIRGQGGHLEFQKLATLLQNPYRNIYGKSGDFK